MSREGYFRDYYQLNRGSCRKKNAAWYKANRERALARGARRAITLKAEVIAAYGGKCNCPCECKEKTFENLTIDHVAGRGIKAKAAIGKGKPRGDTGTRLYSKLKKQGFPQGTVQLLCWNCNCSKGFYGRCPRDISNEPYGVQRALRGMQDKWTCPFCGRQRRELGILSCVECANHIGEVLRHFHFEG